MKEETVMEKTYDFDLSIQFPYPYPDMQEFLESIYSSGYTDASVGAGESWVWLMAQEKGHSREEAFCKICNALNETFLCFVEEN